MRRSRWSPYRVAAVAAVISLMFAAEVWARRPFPFGPGWWPVREPVVPGPHATPEVDPGALRGALVIVVGGVLMLTDRRRPR